MTTAAVNRTHDIGSINKSAMTHADINVRILFNTLVNFPSIT